MLDDQTKDMKCHKCEDHQKSVRKCTLPEYRDKYGKNHIPMVIGDVEYYKCPMGEVDWELWSDAQEAYMLFDKGFLPADGGWGDQTDFFCSSAILVNTRLKQKESDDIKKMKNKRKK